ncbi:hypothetical protein p4 [Pyrus virus A]|uniref:P4 n=1 Tax=Pyrus virus A TaxID=3139198 RepID=A0AAU6RV95_9CLOS
MWSEILFLIFLFLFLVLISPSNSGFLRLTKKGV